MQEYQKASRVFFTKGRLAEEPAPDASSIGSSMPMPKNLVNDRAWRIKLSENSAAKGRHFHEYASNLRCYTPNSLASCE